MTPQGASVSVVNNDVPTDPVALKKLRQEQAAAQVVSAETKVAKAKSHLKEAEKALAEALAAQKGMK